MNEIIEIVEIAPAQQYASTAVVSKALIMTYDATTAKWYPSY